MTTAGEVFRLARTLREVAVAAAADPGEHPPLGVVLITDDIAQHDDTTIGDVAARTGLAQSMVSKVVAQLRAAGVATTRPDDADRRRTLVRISARTRSGMFAARGRRSVADALHDRLPQLTPARAARVEKLIGELAATLSAVDGRSE